MQFPTVGFIHCSMSNVGSVPLKGKAFLDLLFAFMAPVPLKGDVFRDLMFRLMVL